MLKQTIPPGAIHRLDSNPVVAVTEKEAARRKIARDIEAFEKSGGAVDVLKSGMSSNIHLRYNGESRSGAERRKKARTNA